MNQRRKQLFQYETSFCIKQIHFQNAQVSPPLITESSFYTFRVNMSPENIHVLPESEGFTILVTLTPEMNAASNKPSLHLHFIWYPNFTSSDRSWK